MFNLDQLAWTVIDGTAVFLDLAQDRYFRLPDERNCEFVSSVAASQSDYPSQPMSLPRPEAWISPVATSQAMELGPFRLAEVARAVWMQKRTERRLASRPFSSVLFEIRQVLEARECAGIRKESGATRTVQAFEHSRLLRSAADRCLPRSIALSISLAARGCRTHVVLGVKLAPFAAHCWVQSASEVLNDSLEEVQRYTPILVV